MSSTNHSVNIYLNEEAVATSLSKMQAKAASLEAQLKQAASPEEFAKLEKQLTETNSKITVLDKQLKGELNPSIRQMEAAITKTRNELKNMAAGTEEFNNKAKQLRDAEARLKDVQLQTKGVSAALAETGSGAGVFSTLKGKAMEFASGLPGIGQAIGMLMGPFGLIIGLIAGLVAIIRQNAEVADKLSFAMAAAKNVIRALADTLVDFIKNGLGKLKEAIDNPKQALADFGNAVRENIENRFKAVGLILTAIREKDFGKLTDAFVQLGTGVTDISGKVTKFGNTLIQAGKDGYEAAQKLDELGTKQQQLQTAIARTQIAIEKQTTAMKDSTKTDAERLNAANAVISMEALNAQRRIQILQLEQDALNQQTQGRVRNGEEEMKLEQLKTQIIQEEANKQAAIRKAVNEKAALELELNKKAQKDYYDKVNIDAVNSMEQTGLATEKMVGDFTKRSSDTIKFNVEGFKSYAAKAFSDFQSELQDGLEEWGGAVQAGVQFMQTIFSAVTQLQSQQRDEESAKDKKEAEAKKARYKRLLDSNKITQQQYNDAIDSIDKDYNEKEKARKKEAFAQDKAMKIIMATINTALAVVNAFATMPYPAAIVMAALAGATGAVQIGLIAAQPEPQFAKGGIARGARHSEGGISMINSDGQKVGEMEGGEPYMILSRDTYKNNGRLIDALLHTSMHRGGAALNLAEMPRFNFGGMWNAMKATKYAMGGVFNPTTLNDNATLQMLASIDEKLSRSIRAEVTYEDITDRSAAINRASSRASFSK